jgi:hypothetical protein
MIHGTGIVRGRRELPPLSRRGDGAGLAPDATSLLPLPSPSNPGVKSVAARSRLSLRKRTPKPRSQQMLKKRLAENT